MSNTPPTALVADDEPLLRQALIRELAEAWPELEVVTQARGGNDAWSRFEEHQPDVCFLDIHMPGLSGIEVARRIGRRAHVVFVTAFDSYALEAFEQGALDYLVKPIQRGRLAETVSRLQERLGSARPPIGTQALFDELASLLKVGAEVDNLRWIQARVGQSLRLIPVEAIDFLRADEKYTRVAWREDSGEKSEALISTSLRQLLARLDKEQFVQVHRSVVVNLRKVSHFTRNENETGNIHLKQRDEVLPVSRGFLHLFRQM
ncbi:MAG: LytTR family DNA-binding domain-containing protein [Gammaproteobacteria bacterium]|nr:LytTR family DNA-binding domain-containing protein [Gammaproteobacteria bacterium]